MNSTFRVMAGGVLVICSASLVLGCGGGDDSGSGGAGGTSAAGASAGGTSGSAGASAHGGSGGGSTDDGCTGPVVAEWDVDGTHYKSSTSLFTDVGTSYTFNLVACEAPGSSGDRDVEFGYFPSPIAVSTFTLKDPLLGGMSGMISGAMFLDGNTAYKTDADHMGTLKITAMDTTAMTVDGTFEFESVADDGTTTRSITNGVITKMKYTVLQQ